MVGCGQVAQGVPVLGLDLIVGLPGQALNDAAAGVVANDQHQLNFFLLIFILCYLATDLIVT